MPRKKGKKGTAWAPRGYRAPGTEREHTEKRDLGADWDPRGFQEQTRKPSPLIKKRRQQRRGK